MAKRKQPSVLTQLKPQTSLLFVFSTGVAVLSETEISTELVGEKAYGLSLMPSQWTLPFVCVSSDLSKSYKKSNSSADVINLWAPLVFEALLKAGVEATDPIIVRSSGRNEGLFERGHFYSSNGVASQIGLALQKCLDQLLADSETDNVLMPFVIQKFCSPVAAQGHLSNERRCYKEPRDWMGEIELSGPPPSTIPFKINLRAWRKSLKIDNETKKPLTCLLQVRISKVLEIPATWCFLLKSRIHFEWVWDNHRIYLVQADQEVNKDGVSPLEGIEPMPQILGGKALRCIKRSTKNDASQFPKIGNVFTYAALKLPTAPIYILRERAVIESLAKGDIPAPLQKDLELLLPASLVIRSDVGDKSVQKRQLLPRSNELRQMSDATSWLVANSKELISEYPGTEIAFLFHNFIPSISSAFAFAAPDQRYVMIEGLWGIPEGLYYNAHDKYVVDTGASNLRLIQPTAINSFSVKPQQHFKHFFVSPNAGGDWTTKILVPPFDWQDSLKVDWCQYIAYHSRRIADRVGYPVSVMWFAGLKGDAIQAPAIPWHHEKADSAFLAGPITTRRKTTFDKSHIIRNASDIVALEKSLKGGALIRRIRIQPTDEALLRSKETLKKIGSLAQEFNATIILEGGILSHAYYQLLHTQAVVEVVHPFSTFEEKHEFNKLVRDEIPAQIESGGESVKTLTLQGDSLIRSLKEKLVEEALEALDATVQQATLGELADIMEIIDELLVRLELKRDDLFAEQTTKRRKRGGFKKGLVLLETLNAPSAGQQRDSGNKSPSIQVDLLQKAKIHLKEKVTPPVLKLEKWTDKRQDAGGIELKLNLNIPVLLSNWSASTSTESIQGPLAKSIWGEIKGGRHQSKYSVELSVFVRNTQPELGFMDEANASEK